MKLSNRAKSALATAGLAINESSAIAQLVAFAAQNSGIDSSNYYDPHDRFVGRIGIHLEGVRSYNQECRCISLDWRRFKEALITAAAEGVTDEIVIRVAPHAFSGRLTWEPYGKKSEPDQGFVWNYTTGQYFPTEYRKAAANVLEAAIREVRQNREPAKRKVSTIADLKRLNEQNGGCWFGKGEMAFFGTRIESGIIRGQYFITSEQPPHGPRKYSVRQFDDQGDIDTCGEFCSHATKSDALAAIPKE